MIQQLSSATELLLKNRINNSKKPIPEKSTERQMFQFVYRQILSNPPLNKHSDMLHWLTSLA